MPTTPARRRPDAAETVGVVAAIGSALFLPSGPVLRGYAIALAVITLLAIAARRRTNRPRATLPAPRAASTSTTTPTAPASRPGTGR